MTETRCPYLTVRVAGDEAYYFCNLLDHPCDAEYDGSGCEEYDDYIKELEEEL